MATNVLPLRPACVRACAASGHQKTDPGRGRSSWWTPIFGWSSDPDYFDSAGRDGKKPAGGRALQLKTGSSEPEPDPKRPRAGLTEDKARLLRMLTTETTTFHDAMYHSALASRLASDFKNRPDL